MGNSKGTVIKGKDLKAIEGGNSFAALLREEGDAIRRDVLIILNPEESISGRIQSGMTIVYPGCSTKGHAHPDREEVYYFTRGRGIMGVDGEEHEVEAGDTFYVTPGPFHTTKNPYEVPLEFFWITINVQ